MLNFDILRRNIIKVILYFHCFFFSLPTFWWWSSYQLYDKSLEILTLLPLLVSLKDIHSRVLWPWLISRPFKLSVFFLLCVFCFSLLKIRLLNYILPLTAMVRTGVYFLSLTWWQSTLQKQSKEGSICFWLTGWGCHGCEVVTMAGKGWGSWSGWMCSQEFYSWGHHNMRNCLKGWLC